MTPAPRKRIAVPGRSSILTEMFAPKPGPEPEEPEVVEGDTPPAESEPTPVEDAAEPEEPEVQPQTEREQTPLRVKTGKAAAAKKAAAAPRPKARPRVPSKDAARSAGNPGGRQTQTTGNTRQTFFMGADAAAALHTEADRIVGALNGLVYKGTVLDALTYAAIEQGDEVLSELRRQLLAGLEED